MRHVWSVLCQNSSVDRDTNNLSLNNIIEQVAISELPAEEDRPGAAPLQAHVVTLWIRTTLDEPEEGEARLLIDTPEGQRAEGEVVPINLRDHRRYRARQVIQRLPVDDVGLYEFRIQSRADPEDEWQEEAWIPLEVRLLDESE